MTRDIGDKAMNSVFHLRVDDKLQGLLYRLWNVIEANEDLADLHGARLQLQKGNLLSLTGKTGAVLQMQASTVC
jgi:hypothetical protein